MIYIINIIKLTKKLLMWYVFFIINMNQLLMIVLLGHLKIYKQSKSYCKVIAIHLYLNTLNA